MRATGRILAALLLCGALAAVPAGAKGRSAPAVDLDYHEPALPEDPDLPRASLSSSGLDGRAAARLVRDARAAGSDALLVVKDGKLVIEKTFGRPAGPIELYSVTKSVVSLAIGILLEERKIPSLAEPLSTWFASFRKGRKAKVTLRHVLTHTSGLAHRPTIGALHARSNRIAYAEKLRLVEEPGRRFSYNNEAVQLLARVVEVAAGERVDRFVARRIFRPLGIDHHRWAADKSGNPETYSGLSLSARDLARLGLLLLDEGRWRGQPVVPASWVRLATAPAGTSAQLAQSGLLFWIRTRHGRPHDPQVGYYAEGWLGQYLAVLPAPRLVVVRLRRRREGGGLDEHRRCRFPHFLARVEALIGR